MNQLSALFTPIKSAYELVHQAADILENEEDLSVESVKQNYQDLLQQMSKKKDLLGSLSH